MFEKYFEYHRYNTAIKARTSIWLSSDEPNPYALFKDPNGCFCIARMKDFVSSGYTDAAKKIYKLTNFQMICYRKQGGNWTFLDVGYGLNSVWPPHVMQHQNELDAYLLRYERFDF